MPIAIFRDKNSMFWCDRLVENISAPQTINDSKTPSGRAHVGALRGVLIHDAMFRTLRQRGVPVKYRFGCDDYDPVDELPHGMKEHYQQYLGQPLCNTPAPPPELRVARATPLAGEPPVPPSEPTDMADYFIKD